MTKPETFEFTVSVTDDAQRLDRFLHLQNTDTSRSRFKDLIKRELVKTGGRTITEPNHRVKSGETYSVEIPAVVPAIPRPEAMPLSVVYEDDDVIVIDKPAGLVIHPAAGNWTGTLVNGLIAHCGASLSGIGGVRRPGIVHRLDKDTSGLLVIAKNDRAHAGLAAQFAAHGRDHRLERAYLALVWSRPERQHGTIDTLIGRDFANRKKMSVKKDSGKRAITHFHIKESYPVDQKPLISLIENRLETGRTHQIRVHMAHIGHPVLNDAVYGAGFKASAGQLGPGAQSALKALGRQALHAAILGFEHPVTGEAMSFESEVPDSFNKIIEAV